MSQEFQPVLDHLSGGRVPPGVNGGAGLASSPEGNPSDFGLQAETDGMQADGDMDLYGPQSQGLPILGPPALRHPAPQIYPLPECTYEDLVADPGFFSDVYRRFANFMAISLDKVPKLSGKELDLHLLFKEVCKRDGCEKVITKKLWREVANPFDLPKTITSVSFTLRKAYVTFLWDLEQVYYKKAKGAVVEAPPQAEPKKHDPSKVRKKKNPNDRVATFFPNMYPNTPNQVTATATAPGRPDANLVGEVGEVKCDARFDAGYFVTIKLGEETFRGMLYYPPQSHLLESGTWVDALQRGARTIKRPRIQQDTSPNPVMPLGGQQSPLPEALRRRFPQVPAPPAGPHDKEGAPKPPKTAYNFYANAMRSVLKTQFPTMSNADLNRKLGDLWQDLDESSKAPYNQLAQRDKLRYQSELESWHYMSAAQDAAQTGRMHANTLQEELLLTSQLLPVQGLVAGNSQGLMAINEGQGVDPEALLHAGLPVAGLPGMRG
eukprot:jgi/Botrbrau1/2951/Bobra.0026s0022.1